MPNSGIHTLPTLEWIPTKAFSSRHGITPHLIVHHRWGGGSLQGVEHWFENPADDASATFVYAGEKGANAGRCAQMVKIADKPWTNAAYNPWSITIESADAIWVGNDWDGFKRLARITAGLCHYYNVRPDTPVRPRIFEGIGGVVRHNDLGFLGGGHPQCPTTSEGTWRHFMELVRIERTRGRFRKSWAR